MAGLGFGEHGCGGGTVAYRREEADGGETLISADFGERLPDSLDDGPVRIFRYSEDGDTDDDEGVEHPTLRDAIRAVSVPA